MFKVVQSSAWHNKKVVPLTELENIEEDLTLKNCIICLFFYEFRIRGTDHVFGFGHGVFATPVKLTQNVRRQLDM